MASSTPLLHLSYEFLGGSPNISCHEQFWNGKLDGSSWTSCLERSSFVALTRRGEPWQALSGYHRCQWRDQLDLEHHHLLPKPMLPLPMGPLRQELVRRLQLLGAEVLGLGLLALRRGVRIGPRRGVPTSGLLYITLPGVWKPPPPLLLRWSKHKVGRFCSSSRKLFLLKFQWVDLKNKIYNFCFSIVLPG